MSVVILSPIRSFANCLKYGRIFGILKNLLKKSNNPSVFCTGCCFYIVVLAAGVLARHFFKIQHDTNKIPRIKQRPFEACWHDRRRMQFIASFHGRQAVHFTLATDLEGTFSSPFPWPHLACCFVRSNATACVDG